MKKIHPTAIIEDGAEIDEDVEIGAFCCVGPQVKIGRGTKLHTHIELKGDLTIGQDNELFHAVSIGNQGQDTSFDNPQAKIVIGDRNIIRENVTIHLPSEKGGLTSLGNDNFLMVNSHLGHDVKVGNHVAIVVAASISGYVEIDDHAYVSGLVGIHQFCHIGSYAMVSGGSKIAQDVPPYMVASGLPAFTHGLNLVAFRRAKMQPEETRMIKKIYRILYRSGLAYSKALETLKNEVLPTVEENSPAYKQLRYFLDFSARSSRGAIGHIANRDPNYQATLE